MVDLDWIANMASPDTPTTKSPNLSNKLRLSLPTPISAAYISPASSSAYESYLRLPELNKLWNSRDFPDWKNEPLLKPALQALEISFRFVSTVLSDPRPYSNHREWRRRLQSLAAAQIQVIAFLCEDEEEDGEARGTAPIADLSSSGGVLARDNSSAEVWNIPGSQSSQVLVSRTSEASLLPRLSTWQKSEDVAQNILYTMECEMRRCPYTLGLGEPNLAGKPSLEYDAVCKPNELHALKRAPYDHAVRNYENQTLYTTHQILESWIHASLVLLNRIDERIDSERFEQAARDCYSLERIWNLLAEIEDLHLLMDPDDFLQLKSQLGHDSEALWFRSKGLAEMAKQSKDLKHKVPAILGVEVDPKGGPRIQEAAMKLYRREKSGGSEKIHLLQALQAIEAAVKRFFYAYKQVVVVVMGSLEAEGHRVVASYNSCDSLSQIFMEPTAYPSLDAAKTFLGHFWSHGQRV